MSLGVLNNLSAVYAENNLNNSNNSLSKTLQQLSSGSRINSGADDAAGLSLVDGLEANQTALTQSETNASEGVGLLQVADGALSQVTTLLNRAVTLATEAANGTLNSSQDTAANQEYQSILSEISNIGSTTTYNNQAVFNSNTNIYTGDSSTTGSAIDDLNIRTLSSASIGDTGGAMAYSSTNSSGSSDLFMDMSHTAAGVTTDAQLGDFLNSGTPGTAESVTIDTLNADGTIKSNTVSTGNSSTEGYANTVGGLINAINGAGLGVTASLTTGVAAGDSAAGEDTGIMITGNVVAGTTPSTSSFSGKLTINGETALTDTLTGSITIQDGTGPAQTISMAQVAGSSEGLANGTNTADLAGLVNYINDYSTSANNTTETDVFGVHAAIGADGLTLTSATGNDVANQDALTVSTTLSDSSAITAPLTYTATAPYAVGFTSAAAFDDTSGQTAAATVATGTSVAAGGGVATIQYSDKAGQSLATTNLTDSASAQTALTDLNTAITDVAAQDGYIGAQINTLNAVSNVLSTQAENVQSAQNAVQATDYASASSNMSKYEILSQTGISALAQANSMQQEVTKLLQ